MAYQDVKKGLISPSRPFARTADVFAQDQIDFLAKNLQQLSQEVVLCHNLVWNFAVAVGNGLTTLAVTLPARMPDANYFVGVQANFNNGGTWVTAKTTTGFTLNWVTATVGTQAARFLIVG